MTTELWYLFLTTVLLIILGIPHIIGQVINGGLLSRGGLHQAAQC